MTNVSILDFLRLLQEDYCKRVQNSLQKKMYNVIRYRYKNEKLKSIIVYLIELFESHEKNIDIISRVYIFWLWKNYIAYMPWFQQKKFVSATKSHLIYYKHLICIYVVLALIDDVILVIDDINVKSFHSTNLVDKEFIQIHIFVQISSIPLDLQECFSQ